jgi:hypothetical protein
LSRRGGGWKSRRLSGRVCALLAGSPCPAISGHSGCVLKRPGMAAPARRRIRMIMARLARRASLGSLGSLPALTGVVARRGAARSIPSRCAVLPYVRRGSSRGRPSVVPACGVTRFGGPERTGVRVSSPTIMPGEPVFHGDERLVEGPNAGDTGPGRHIGCSFHRPSGASGTSRKSCTNGMIAIAC